LGRGQVNGKKKDLGKRFETPWNCSKNGKNLKEGGADIDLKGKTRMGVKTKKKKDNCTDEFNVALG